MDRITQRLPEQAPLSSVGRGLARRRKRAVLSRVGASAIVATLLAAGSVQTQTFAIAVPVDANSISGFVWEDLNADGIRDSFDPALPGVEVYAFNDAGEKKGPVVSGSDGSYELVVDTTDTQWRVQADAPPGMYDGYLSTDGSQQSASDVRFASTTDTNVNFSFQRADHYAEVNPYVYVPTRQKGTIQEHGPNSRGGGVQRWNADGNYYDNEGTWVVPFAQVGTTWGSAWVRPQATGQLGTLYASAAVVGYSGFGPGGIGAIYRIVPDSPTMESPTAHAELLVDLTQFGVNLGARVGDVTFTPTGQDRRQSNPGAAEPAVGRAGLGGIVANGDGSRLYTVNMHERKLIEIVLSDANTVSSVAQHDLPTSVAEVRPWGITIDPRTGDVLVSGASETTARYVVWRVPVDSSTHTLGAAAEVAQGGTGGDRWTDVARWNAYNSFVASNIEFKHDGSLVINLLNRAGLQFAYQIDGWGNGTFAAHRGRIGTLPPAESGGFGQVSWISTKWHGEVSSDGFDSALGSTTFNTLTHETLNTSVGVLPRLIGGEGRLERDRNSVLRFDESWKWSGTRTNNTNWNGSNILAKASGLGDLSQMIGAAPVEIGNRVWFDADHDGIQDPTEIPVEGVTVTLLDPKGEPVLGADGLPITTVTNELGVWKFRSDEVALVTHTEYRVRFDATGLPESTVAKLAAVGVEDPARMVWTTKVDSAERTGSNPDPTDPLAAGVTDVFTTGGPGENDHTIDAGLWVSSDELTFEKTSDPASGTLVQPGDEITYTVSVKNESKASVAEGEVVDDLSKVLDKATMKTGAEPSLKCEPVSGTPKPTANCGEIHFDAEAKTVTWKATTAHPIDGQTIARIVYTVIVDKDATGDVGNVLVDTEIKTEHPLLGTGKISDPVTGSTVVPGQQITYTIWFENSGEVKATGMLNAQGETMPLSFVDDLSDVVDKATLLPDSVSPMITTKTTTAGTSCDVAGGPAVGETSWDADAKTITWSDETLAADTRVCVSYQVKVNEGAVGTLKNVFLDHTTEHPLPVSLEWMKVDAERTALVGSEWSLHPILTDDEGNMVLDEKGDPQIDPSRDIIEHIDDCWGDEPTCNGVDANAGRGQFKVDGLVPGLYELTETKAPAGFVKLKAPIYVDVASDRSVTVYGEIVNQQQAVPGLPLTGGIGSDYLLIAGGIAGLLVLMLTVRSELKRRRLSDISAL